MQRFRVAQKIVLFNDKNEVLIVRFAKHPENAEGLWGMWDFPGGGLEWGESLEEGLRRELREELGGGLEFSYDHPLLTWDWIHQKDKELRSVCTLFRGKFLGGEIRLNHEHDQYEWTRVENLLKFEWKEEDGEAVKRLQKLFGVGGVHGEWVKYPTGLIPKGEWCDGCKRYNVRNSTVEVVVVQGNRLLMIQRGQDPQAGWWALPAGYVGWDETLEEAAARELKEEVGLTADSVALLGVYSDPKRDLDGRQNIAHAFLAQVSGEVAENRQEVSQLQWFELHSLPEKIAFDHKKMIEDYIKKQETMSKK